jgi:tetratricopeptide (TPR) repeat protein
MQGTIVLGLVVAVTIVAVWNLRLWRKNNRQWAESRLNASVREALANGTDRMLRSDGAEACRDFLAAHPNSPNAATARLYLATFLTRLRDFRAAEGEFQKIVEGEGKASPTQQAYAYNGLGVVKMISCTEAERPKAAAEARVFFVKALETNSQCTDARINLEITKLWGGGKQEGEEALKNLNEIANGLLGKPQKYEPPGLEAALQLHNARGVAYSRIDDFQEAAAAFDSALAIVPHWNPAVTNQTRCRTLEAAARKTN